MTKADLLPLILARLEANLALARHAAQTAHEAATHEENIAENKYDTLGLEAAYLAAGQARRVEEIRQALSRYQNLQLRPFDAERGIQLTALVRLVDGQDEELMLFLGPDAAGLKVQDGDRPVMVITPHSPLGQRLLGRGEGDEIELTLAGVRQRYEVLQVS
ncbi:Transcription elongation factor, GreA/GreB, C-term [Azotobacter beijerinckii]|uniref:Transcription elongation factor, GreA/GreB, C-term n=1 Tax=Azotobacter beijerinckii TaxID=170623 RepID=A0A1H9DSY9_9GAMM|nr:GreA/GreB family elongation factor [Azotobacter beijerinckii]SEQ16584.1 Transcription elongation factor, GreA/GreB, C-term [Azotobacter beijerinckii]